MPEVPHAGRYGGPEEVGSFFGSVAETLDNEWAMAWSLRDGKVAGWQIYEDTARELAAHA